MKNERPQYLQHISLSPQQSSLQTEWHHTPTPLHCTISCTQEDVCDPSKYQIMCMQDCILSDDLNDQI